jgi:hypothetical protein
MNGFFFDTLTFNPQLNSIKAEMEDFVLKD